LTHPPSASHDRILYVDDEKEARDAFATVAHELGFRVDTADGGGEALTKASRHRYAVIATDLRMPTLNGLSLIQLLRPKWPDSSYLIVTGASHLELPRQGNGDPLVDDVVSKPWKLDDLAGILGRAIDRYRSRRRDASLLDDDERPSLVVSPDPLTAETWKGWLDSAFPDSDAIVVGSTDEAAHAMAERAFRVALVDFEIEGGGLSGIKRLRNAGKQLTLVAIGTFDDEDLARRALSAGADDYVAKEALTSYVLRQSLRHAAERRQSEERIAFLSQRDPVTGLLNRNLFREGLDRALDEAGRRRTRLAVLLLDLDRFKNVNDSLGHAVGDQLLEVVGSRLRENLGETDTVARLGGDEFAVLLERVGGADEATAVAQRLLEALVPPVRLNEYEIVITGSVGIALFPDHGQASGELLQRADKAMYRAKENGRDGCATYSIEHEESRSRVLERLRFESGVRHALERREYVVHYQPQMTVDRTRFVGVEALVRWNHPKVGLVPPSKFMPFLEGTGLIKGVGAWVLETACNEIRQWQVRGHEELRVSVNLSARQFDGPDLVSTVERVLGASGLPPGRLELEITESLLMQDVDRTLAILDELKALGVRIAIDDFGIGYSSLAYLKKFPIDCLKIDGSFVRDIDVDLDDRAVAEAIIGLGHNLRLDVVAEGVETEPQLELLRGCDGFQGYLIARPQAADLTLELIESH
jgi:diguanylate cyclase (GGDEF)-like protein